MPNKDEIAANAAKFTNLAVEELAKEGKDPEAIIKLKQRDLAHIASLSTTYTILGMKEQLEAWQETVKEYVLLQVAQDLPDFSDLEAKVNRLEAVNARLKRCEERLTTIFGVLDVHYDKIQSMVEDTE